MNNKQHLVKHTTAFLLVTLLIVAVALSMGAYADEHDRNVVEYDVTEMGDVDVPYNSLLEVTGDSINEGDAYVLYNTEGDRTEITAVVDETDTLVFDTSVLGTDYDPRGDWEIKSVPEGEVTAVDQDTDETTVIVEEAQSNVDYDVYVYDVDGDGNADFSNSIGSESFNAETQILDYEITVEMMDEGENQVVIGVAEQGEVVNDESDLLAMTNTITLDVDSTNSLPGDSDTEENEFERLSFDFTIVEGLEDDRRVQLDIFDIDGTDVTTVQLDRVWEGQHLILSSNDLDEANTYDLRRVNDDGEGGSQLITELSAQNSDTVNTHEFSIDTTYDEFQDVDAEGDFYIEGPNGVLVEWNAVTQNLNAELNETTVNQYTDNTQVDLNMTSIRTGPTDRDYTSDGYDVLIDSEGVTAEELMDLIDERELDGDVGVHIEDEYDDDNEQVRLTGVLTPEVFTVPLEFANADEMTYSFNLDVVDTTAEASTGDVEVGEISEGDAQFTQGTFVQNQGDIVDIEIDMSNTDVATFKFTEEDDYDIEFDVIDADNSGSVTISMDTYRAGDHDREVEEVFNTDEGTEIDASEDLPPVAGVFDTGVYEMQLVVNQRDTDAGALVIQERESHNINTWVMPHDADSTLDDLEEFGTQQEKVAMNDMFVVEVEASGLYANDLLNEDTTGEDLVKYWEREDTSDVTDTLPELGLEIKTQYPDRHDANTTLLLEEAEVEVVPEENKFYVFLDTSENIYDNFDEDFPIQELIQYDIDFDVSTDYKYKSDGDDDDASLHETVEFVERIIETHLPSVTVDEETLDTKHGLTNVENSTITGVTDIAPHTTNIDVVVRTAEAIEDANPESAFFVETVEVDENNRISAQFDLSQFELDRDMEIKFRPVDNNEYGPVEYNGYRQAVIIEPELPPEITEFSSDDTPVTEGNEVGFNLDVDSHDDALNYNWDFGDDEGTSAQISPAYVYDSPGTYEVTVTVTDSSDQSDTATTEIVVEEAPNEPPEIEQIIAPTESEVGDELTFTAIAFDDGPQSELQYTWDFDDGSTGAGVSTSQTFSTEGTYDVAVTVTDNQGASTTESTTVQVTDPSAGAEEDDGPYDFTITTVDDESDESIPGVSITILQDGNEVESLSTDGNGIAVAELEDGEYDIEAAVDGYQDRSSGTLIDGEDNELQLSMTLEDSGGEEDPSQPGFTALLAALAMISGGLIAYRRKAN